MGKGKPRSDPWGGVECNRAPPVDQHAPIMADIMSGPNAPLTKAFIMAGWRTVTFDMLINKDHDLSETECQLMVHNALSVVDFIWAALDCSTKARCRSIPGKFADGRKMPQPLRSNEFQWACQD